MEKKLKCLRCGNEMVFISGEKLQLGESGIPFSNLVSGALEVDIYHCTVCGKIEFYHMKDELIKKIQCPNCGKIHHRDYPKCPFCKHNYKSK